MANFLDLTTGLPALWAKIKSKFYTKAEVDAAIPSASSTSPEMDGTATVGVSTAYARADHVHPSDTSRAAVVDVLTKTNTTSYAPTADYNPATKKYVDDSIPTPDVFWVNIEYTSGSGYQAIYTSDKSYGEVNNAIYSGKSVVANEGGQIYYWDGYYYISFVNDEGSYYLKYFSYINNTDTDNTLSASAYSWADASSIENKANVWDVLTKTNTTSYTPTANYHPATKKYVDDTVAAIPNEVLVVTFTYDRYENSSYIYIADKSNTEITNAYSAGKIVMGKTQDGGGAYLFNGGGFFATQPDEDYPIISYFYYYGSDYEYSGDFISLIDSNRFYNSVLYKTNTDAYTPTSDYNPATKKYVDDAVGAVSTSVSELTDTTISSPSAGQALIYDSTNSKWVNGSVALDVVSLTDTTISSPADGQVLKYDSTTSKWVNATLSTGITETRVNELIAAALAQYGDGDTATYGYNDASEVNY